MDTTIDTETFLDRVGALAGIPDRVAAANATWATLTALAAFLATNERVALGRAMPREWREAFEAKHVDLGAPRAFDRETFFALAAAGESVGPAFGREHAISVCRALGELLPEELVRRFARAVPELGALFDLPRRDSEPPPYGVGRYVRQTLATGRPGSEHPISDSRPPGGHRHSVEEANPHGDTKLGSSEGLTQEREGQSLATAHRSDRRGIAERR